MKIIVICEKGEQINNFDVASVASNAIFEIMDKSDSETLDYQTIVSLLYVEGK